MRVGMGGLGGGGGRCSMAENLNKTMQKYVGFSCDKCMLIYKKSYILSVLLTTFSWHELFPMILYLSRNTDKDIRNALNKKEERLCLRNTAVLIT